MSRKSDGDYIEQYAIKVIYSKKFKREGSGFLVKVNQSTVYLFTAKHNFKKNDDDEYYDVNIEELKNNLNLITIAKGDNQPYLEIESILFEVEKLDLIVFKIKNTNSQKIGDIPITSNFLNDSRFLEEKCFFYGYPNNTTGRAELGLVHISKNIENTTFSLQRGLNIKNTSYFAGYSGSGVFIKKNDVYYIVGIVIKADDKLDNFEVIELSKVIDKINQKIFKTSLQQIPIEEHVFDMVDVSEMYETLLKRHPSNTFMQVLSRSFGKEHKYKDLIDSSDKLEKINAYTNNTNDFKKIEHKYTQELADIYLMSTFLASIYSDKEKAKEHFEVACKYRPQYNLFLTEIDKENSKEELLTSAKVAYADEEYPYSEKCFIKVLSLNCSYEEKKNITNYLLNIAKKEEDKVKQFEFYYKLFYLSFDNLEKAKILYEVSFLIDDKDEKIKILNMAQSHIEENHDFLELEYLIKKELYKFSRSKEKYKKLKNILYNLVKIKPHYKIELLEMRYNELQKFIVQLIKPAKILIIFLVFWLIYLLL